MNDDLIVNGATNLNTNANSDVAIVDSTGNDTMRVNDAGDITLKRAGIVSIALFKANRGVSFYGNI